MNTFKQYVNPHLGNMLESIKMDKSFIKGKGSYLFDAKGNRYLDLIAAYGALPLGYNPNEVWEAILEVNQKEEPSFIQPSALDAAGELAQKLIDITPEGLKYVTFTNSGAETVEAAIKLCRSATKRMGILSVHNSFHGKTLGALSATGKSYYQSVFGAPANGFNYIPYGDIEALLNEFKENPNYYAAFIIEPVQGEGGIVTPPKGYLREVRQICDEYGVKLILDEIQTGLGRTGRLFAFEEDEIVPDVLLLAKALSGGIIPIGACICTEEVYNEEFALKHSSTFAGNTLACRVAMRVLELLTKDTCILDNVNKCGDILKNGLIRLRDTYPNVIKEIRGKGLMLGIDFGVNKNTFRGSLLGVMAEQELLTPIVSSYLLNVEKVRVAPTLNGNTVIRIEPALNITEHECSIALESIGNMLEVLSKGNTAKLLSYLIEVPIDNNQNNCAKESANQPIHIEDSDSRFAFLIHPLDLRNYSDYDQSLSCFSIDELKELTERWNEMVEPFVVSEAIITSKCGNRAYGEFIVVPRTADELVKMPREEAIEQLKKALNLAKKRGAKIVGLGAYTSVVSGGGLYLKDEAIPLTTGNSYTVVSAVDAVMEALIRLGEKPQHSIAAIVGATGSIGFGASILLSEKVSKMILIGNPNNKESSIKRLHKVAANIYKHLAELIERNTIFELGSIGYILSNKYKLPHSSATIEEFISFAIELDKNNGPIQTTTDIDEMLVYADIVISATSNVGKLIDADNLKPGAIVCDMSRPRNVSEDVSVLREDVLIIDGGIVEVPGRPNLGLSLGFDQGLAYACMSETIMLALEKHYEHTSVGASGISIDSILYTKELGEKHGFKLADFRSFDKNIESERWENAKKARKNSFLSLA